MMSMAMRKSLQVQGFLYLWKAGTEMLEKRLFMHFTDSTSHILIRWQRHIMAT